MECQRPEDKEPKDQEENQTGQEGQKEEPMNNPFDEIRAAVSEAQDQLLAVDAFSVDMARMLQGRLRHVDNPTVLRKLKRELQGFNAVTGKWNDKPL